MPRVSRLTLTLLCSDHVQLSPPVDLCVRELSPPLSIVNRVLWYAWWGSAPLHATPVELLVRAVFWLTWRVGVRVLFLFLSFILVNKLKGLSVAHNLADPKDAHKYATTTPQRSMIRH